MRGANTGTKHILMKLKIIRTSAGFIQLSAPSALSDNFYFSCPRVVTDNTGSLILPQDQKNKTNVLAGVVLEHTSNTSLTNTAI